MVSPPGCDQILQRLAEGEMGVPAKCRYSSCRMHLKHHTSCLLSPGRSYCYNFISADHAPLQGSAPKQSTGMEEMASSGQGQGDKDEASVGRHWAGI